MRIKGTNSSQSLISLFCRIPALRLKELDLNHFHESFLFERHKIDLNELTLLTGVGMLAFSFIKISKFYRYRKSSLKLSDIFLLS